jgi:hypothetical protein
MKTHLDSGLQHCLFSPKDGKWQIPSNLMSATGAEFTRTFLFFGIEPSDGRPCGDFPAEHKADATWAWNFLMGNTFLIFRILQFRLYKNHALAMVSVW